MLTISILFSAIWKTRNTRKPQKPQKRFRAFRAFLVVHVHLCQKENYSFENVVLLQNNSHFNLMNIYSSHIFTMDFIFIALIFSIFFEVAVLIYLSPEDMVNSLFSLRSTCFLLNQISTSAIWRINNFWGCILDCLTLSVIFVFNMFAADDEISRHSGRGGSGRNIFCVF